MKCVGKLILVMNTCDFSVYDGKNIPVAADDAVFRLKVGLADLNDPEAAEAAVLTHIKNARDRLFKEEDNQNGIDDSTENN